MEALQLKRGQAVRVLWQDSASEVGWKYHYESAGLNAICSLGFVVTCKPEFLAITSSMDDSSGVIDPLAIPWGAIKDVQIVEEHSLVK